jgi:hypothetical protein
MQGRGRGGLGKGGAGVGAATAPPRGGPCGAARAEGAKVLATLGQVSTPVTPYPVPYPAPHPRDVEVVALDLPDHPHAHARHANPRELARGRRRAAAHGRLPPRVGRSGGARDTRRGRIIVRAEAFGEARGLGTGLAAPGAGARTLRGASAAPRGQRRAPHALPPPSAGAPRCARRAARTLRRPARLPARVHLFSWADDVYDGKYGTSRPI